MPVIVSTKIAKAIRKSIPVIGKKNADITVKSWRDDFCIDAVKMDNCVFISLVFVLWLHGIPYIK